MTENKEESWPPMWLRRERKWKALSRLHSPREEERNAKQKHYHRWGLTFLESDATSALFPFFFFPFLIWQKEKMLVTVVSNSSWPVDCSPTGYSPWNSPGKNTGVSSHSLLQEIFPTQGLNLHLLHCWQILYSLSHYEIPNLTESVPT